MKPREPILELNRHTGHLNLFITKMECQVFPSNVNRSNSNPAGQQEAGCNPSETGRGLFANRGSLVPAQHAGGLMAVGQQAGSETSESSSLRPAVAVAGNLARAGARLEPPSLETLNLNQHWQNAVQQADPDRTDTGANGSNAAAQDDYDNAWINAFPRNNQN